MIDQPLNRKTKTIKVGPLPGKDPFHVPAQGLHQGGDDDHKQHVLNCAVEIHYTATVATGDHENNYRVPESAKVPSRPACSILMPRQVATRETKFT